MVTIEDIAKYANVSVSTVSLVLNEKGNISEKTRARVKTAVRTLGYKPNLQARILRSKTNVIPYITLFWASDIRSRILTRFLKGMQVALALESVKCEIITKQYASDCLHESLDERVLLSSNGIIVCNASEQDLLFLSENSFPVPIVLYNRRLAGFSSVSMDDSSIGEMPAELFAKNGLHRPAVLKPPVVFSGMNTRLNAFELTTIKCGMEYPVSFLVDDSMRGGYEGAVRLVKSGCKPDCLFCLSEDITVGALKAFHENGISLPKDLQLISLAVSNSELLEYTEPAVSTINLPIDDMAGECVRMILDMFNSNGEEKQSKIKGIQYIERDSCKSL